MLSSQRQQMRCLACQALFETHTPTNVPLEAALGFMKGLRCTACGSKNIGFGQNRTLAEDRGFARGTGYRERIDAWWENGELGGASQTIAERLDGRRFTRGDAVDGLGSFRLCLLLLDRVPEWVARMPELAALSPTWARLAAAWPDLTASLYRECGDNLERVPAPETHALLQGVLREPAIVD